MPQILYKKNGNYKPKNGDQSQICATFKCTSTVKRIIDGKHEVAAQSKDTNQHTLAFGEGEPPKDTRIGPPFIGIVKHSIPEDSGRTDESTYKQCALVAAKLKYNEWELPGSSSRDNPSGSSSSSSSSDGAIHPSFFKHGSLIPTTTSGYNWRKRRFAIDLGRRAKVFGKYLCSIDEEEEHDFDIYESFKTFHIMP